MSTYKRNMLIVAIVAAVAGVAAVVVAVWPSNDPNGITNSGSGSCVISGAQNSCTVNTALQILKDPSADVAEIRRQLLEAGSGTKPSGQGPWQFAVLDTGPVGLKVVVAPVPMASK